VSHRHVHKWHWDPVEGVFICLACRKRRPRWDKAEQPESTEAELRERTDDDDILLTTFGA
jgi:hypothetical protein